MERKNSKKGKKKKKKKKKKNDFFFMLRVSAFRREPRPQTNKTTMEKRTNQKQNKKTHSLKFFGKKRRSVKVEF
jgi:hypothetical protein